MKASFAVDRSSWGHVEVALRNIALKVPNHASRTMRRAAARMVAKAKMYVPEDTAALMESIRVEEGRGARGRLQLNLVVGGETIVNARGKSINLDQYAEIIHENYEAILVYGPGDRTQEKMDMYGADKVGSGFLTRAADEERASLDREMIDGIKKIIKLENME